MELTSKQENKHQAFFKERNLNNPSSIDFLETSITGTSENILEQALQGLPDCIISTFSFVASKMKIRYTEIFVEPIILKSKDYNTITNVDFILKLKTNTPKEIINYCFEEVLKTCPASVLCEKYCISMNYEIIML
jgi:hypothetical protein